MTFPRGCGFHIRTLCPVAFTLVVMISGVPLERPAQAASAPSGARAAADTAMRLADAGRFAAAESLLRTQQPATPDSAAALDADQLALERARLHARQHAPGLCDTTWMWRPARVLAALERTGARPEEIATVWSERSRVEYRLGAWPAAISSGETALRVLDRARSRAPAPRYRAHLALAEVLANFDAPRARPHWAAADSLAPLAGGSVATERPRHQRVAGAIAILEGDMPGAARRMAACVAAADSLVPANDAEAGLGLVLQGYAEGFTASSLAETHRARGRERLKNGPGLGDERTLQGLGRSVSNVDSALLPSLGAELDRAQAWLREHGCTEHAAAWDVDYFGGRVKTRLTRYDDALEMLRHALAVSRRWQGPDNLREMTTRTDIAIVDYLKKDTPSALSEIQRVLQLSARFPLSIPNDPNIPLNYLALGLMNDGHYAESRAMYKAMWENYRDRYGESFRLVSPPARQALRLSRALGDSAGVELWYRRAMKPYEHGENGTREDLAENRASYSLFLFGMGSWRGACDLAFEGARLRREIVDETVPWLADGDAAAFVVNRRQDQSLLASLALSEPAMPPGIRCDVWSEVALGRGLMLEARLRRVRRGPDPDTVVSAMRRDLAALVLASFTGVDSRAARVRRDSLRSEITRRELVGGAASPEPAASAVRPGAVSQRLGGGTLVSYLRTSLYEKQNMIGNVDFKPREFYMAFVLAHGDSVPRAVALAGADTVEQAIRAWREAWPVRQGADTLAATGERLRRLVWDPVLASLPTQGDVWIVPDGELQKVNFYALPAGPGRFLVDEPRVLHRIGAERDLLAPSMGAPAVGVLAVGGVDYDRAKPESAAADARGATKLPACRAFLDSRFEPLPATAGEAATIASLARSLPGAGASPALTLTGLGADEATLKRVAPGRRVIHLATHSFCLGPECASGAGAANVVTQNPLVFSGIALAGANRWQEARDRREADDGLLTAEELAGLDLRGTEWLVLSGCESGLGQVQSWEGVLGLPRAGRRAGVRTMVMSLAPVDDEASARWMRALYEAHFTRVEPTALAVRSASREVLDWLRRQHRAPEPRLWAAFVAQGE